MTLIDRLSSAVHSYSDESSPRTYLTGDRKVEVRGEVLRDDPLEWYAALRAQRPDVSEWKGKILLEELPSLPAGLRRRVKQGLRRVRIHIQDPRPYIFEHDRIWRRVAGEPFNWAEMEGRRHHGDEQARRILDFAENTVSRLLLHESALGRLSYLVESTGAAGVVVFPAGDSQEEEDLFRHAMETDLRKLTSDGASLVRRVTEYTAKMAPVFISAREIALKRAFQDLRQIRYTTFGSQIPGHLREALHLRHGYDKGDRALVDMVDERRKDLVERLQRRPPFGEGTDRLVPLREDTTDSIVSPHVQAADMAARYASVLYEKPDDGGLDRIVHEFEYVSFNGRRVSAKDAKDYVLKWDGQI